MFLSHVMSVAREEFRELSFRAYVTRQMVLMAQNKTRTDDWLSDIVMFKTEEERDNADEVAKDVIRRAGLVVRT